MSAPSTPRPEVEQNPQPESFFSRHAGAIIGISALGLIILATVWSMFRGP